MRRMLLISAVILLIGSVSCSKVSLPQSFIGDWTIHQVYGNTSWGAPLHWMDVPPITKIRFTSNGEYFRRTGDMNNYALIGTYQILSDNKIKITWANPPNPSVPSYTLDYTFEKGGFMTWGILATEGTVQEKYKKNK